MDFFEIFGGSEMMILIHVGWMYEWDLLKLSFLLPIDKQYQPISSNARVCEGYKHPKTQRQLQMDWPFFDGAIPGLAPARPYAVQKFIILVGVHQLIPQNGQIASLILQVSWSCWTYLGVLVPSSD